MMKSRDILSFFFNVLIHISVKKKKIGLWDNDDRKEMEKSSSLYKMHRK